MKEGLDLAELPCINCAAGKYKAAADVNIACNQCEAAPRGIAFQRFLDQYDNCLQPGTGRDTNDHCVVCGPRQRYSGVCRTSCDLYHSSKSDGQHEWRTEEAPRVVASSLLLRGPLVTSWVPQTVIATSCNDVCWSLGRSCNLEATRNLNTKQVVRGVLSTRTLNTLKF